MTDRIQDAKDRAMDVINGFKRPSNRNAMDVIMLVEIITKMERQAAGKAFSSAGGTGTPDFLKSIFGGR